jgi:hypothetical protein
MHGLACVKAWGDVAKLRPGPRLRSSDDTSDLVVALYAEADEWLSGAHARSAQSSGPRLCLLGGVSRSARVGGPR